MSALSSKFPTFTGEIVDGGRLRLDTLLGFGGYGVVYKATDLQDPSHPTYAVKWLGLPYSYYDRSHQAQKRYLNGLEQEYKNHQRVSSHPNIITLHRVVQDDERCCKWMVLDFALGGDVFEAQTRANPFWRNEERTRSVMLQILDAVYYCHSQGIYHRDIKPENLLLSADANIVYLSDFGASTAKRYSGDDMGTVEYMTPEQYCPQYRATTIYGDLYSSSRADAWACAMTLFGMLVGDVAWTYAHPTSDTYRLTLTYLRLGQLDTMLPISRNMQELFQSCFEEDPVRRIRIDDMRAIIADITPIFPGHVRGEARGRAVWLDEISKNWPTHLYPELSLQPDSYAAAAAPSEDSIKCIDRDSIGLLTPSFGGTTDLSSFLSDVLSPIERPRAPCPSFYSSACSSSTSSSDYASITSALETPAQLPANPPITLEELSELDLSDALQDREAVFPVIHTATSIAGARDLALITTDIMKTPMIDENCMTAVVAPGGKDRFWQLFMS